MNCYSQIIHPEVEVGKHLPILNLKNVIIEACDSITPKELGRLTASLPASFFFLAIIKTEGGPTKY